MSAAPEQSDVAPLESILEEAVEATDDEKTTVGDIIDAFGAQSLGPMLILFGLLALFPPIGAVPGVPIVLGAVLALYAVQFIVGKERVWVPARLRRISFERAKLEKARERMSPWLSRIDRLFRERMSFATGKLMSRFVGVAALIHAGLMIPLEFVSLVAIPGAALVFFGVALTARDGLMMIIGWTITAAAFYVTVFMVPWGKITEAAAKLL
ncbi:exopolysaccharide biosynthesis protein [Parvularcula maris]|uniref:Exopolysaccharide biosynthesis protein n=1 Tax=Parvularcula maris TaxID=2965077 RepID=A0A9X2LA69_9PROT|nr:exopolysaccharide biosynthesis protein [Parvularcula maris]MCQ8185914.1 exopolysaccharide biosynthesis protein [Parvularcula maris]